MIVCNYKYSSNSRSMRYQECKHISKVGGSEDVNEPKSKRLSKPKEDDNFLPMNVHNH